MATSSTTQSAVATPQIATEAMRDIYEQTKTPFKYGIVIHPPQGKIVDCPSVFRFSGKWHMFYIQWTREIGYETHLADSEDLLHWEPRGKILSFREGDTWDKWQAGGTIQLIDHRWEGSHEPQQFAGKYWMTYLGGARQGYETDPLAIGMATNGCIPGHNTDDSFRAPRGGRPKWSF